MGIGGIDSKSFINPFQNAVPKSGVEKANVEKKVEKALEDGVLSKSEFLQIKDELNIKGSSAGLDKILEQLPTDQEVAAALSSAKDSQGLQARMEKVFPELKKLLDAEFSPISFSQPKTKADAFVSKLKALTPQEDTPAAPGAAASASEEMTNLYNNPLGARIYDVGVDKFKDSINNSEMSVQNYKDLTLGELKGTVKAKVKEFADKLGDNKEAMVYLNHMMTARKPALSDDQKLAVIASLTEMLNTDQSKYNPAIKDKKELITQAMHDIAAPENISQGNIASCAGTSVQIELAIKNPEKYLKMLHTLAKGESFPVNGGSIPPNFSFAEEGKDGKFDTGRSITAKLLQNSIMDFGDAARRAYNSSDITHNSGMLDTESVNVKNALYGTTNKVYDGAEYSPKQMIEILGKARPSRENPVQISMAFMGSGKDANHAVNVIGIDETKKTATIINPWGRIETFPLKNLEERIYGIVATDNLGPKKLDTIEFGKISAVDAASQIKSKGDDFLNTLSLDQKAKLAKTLLDAGDKGSVLKVLENVLQSSGVQDEQFANAFFPAFANNGVTLYPGLLNTLKSDDPLFLRVAADLAASAPNMTMAADLLNDPAIGQKFADSMSMDNKTRILGNLTSNYPTFVTPENANKAISTLLGSTKNDAGFDMNKFIAATGPKVKVFLATLDTPATKGMLASATPEQKIEIFRYIAGEQMNPALPADQKALSQKAALAMVKSMTEGKDEAGQKEAVKKLATALGWGDGKTPEKVLQDGKAYLEKFLPAGADTTKILGLVS